MRFNNQLFITPLNLRQRPKETKNESRKNTSYTISEKGPMNFYNFLTEELCVVKEFG